MLVFDEGRPEPHQRYAAMGGEMTGSGRHNVPGSTLAGASVIAVTMASSSHVPAWVNAVATLCAGATAAMAFDLSAAKKNTNDGT